MKLFVQIPCLNEAETLPLVLATIPREMPGIDEVEILVIDDGSTDATVEVARRLGVRHFVRHARTMGLARSFRDGVDYALRHGADIVVNTDGDNQYPQERIGDLVAPVVGGEADIAIADRQTGTIEHFSPLKKVLQKVGSEVVNFAAETDLPDAASGFRAYSRASLMRLNVVTQFSYCMETIIQAGNKRLRIASVPVTTNPKTRESRLFSSMGQHIRKSGQAITRSYLMYKPHTVFVTLGVIFGLGYLIPFGRYLVLLMLGQAGQHIQSLILGSSMLVGALLSFALLVIADLLKTNRTLMEETLERLKEVQYGRDSHAVPKVVALAAVSGATAGADGEAGASAWHDATSDTTAPADTHDGPATDHRGTAEPGGEPGETGTSARPALRAGRSEVHRDAPGGRAEEPAGRS
ncbi:glycosyltransferase family 2 protein [Myceligenerans xiligouense]|uniref:Glycosyltransferase involved in cell wall biosynthesis n=1 Tax=Myceligenerans xiligouense TaxID=253184 RepID=A0A3N4YG47_9MICO|nr:glycosyltransferase family 2 protein [Myceligenerans xiligouense]RPF20109.1 glycosyltransferase involved in cell wall biosynthesis [Myceligenerans xiligouense]